MALLASEPSFLIFPKMGRVLFLFLCLFSFKRGSLYQWQEFIVRQKITIIFLHVYLPQDTSLRTGSEPLGLTLAPPTWLGRLDSNSEIVNMSKGFSSEPSLMYLFLGYKDGYKLIVPLNNNYICS